MKSTYFCSSVVLAGFRIAIFASMSFLLSVAVQAENETACDDVKLFTFSWPFSVSCDMQPRGGTSTGPQVVLDTNPSDSWLALQDPELSDFERDRIAILGMAGPYRTSFDFIEVAGYTPSYEPSKPYQSWSTEYVYILEEQPEFISLQHIIVMFFVSDGEVSGPVVMKHWRQDWQYQKEEVLAYNGNDIWIKEPIPSVALKGSWSQAVFQVDDSPRYESWGHWEHKPNFSTWKSAETLRPLPRRESSVRDDYQVLQGTNRHTIMPNGWLHEEENYKVVLDETEGMAAMPYLAKELGVNRYDRIIEHDFSAGDDYLDRTAQYWADVRAVWSEIVSNLDTELTRVENEGVPPMFGKMFGDAESVQTEADYDSKAWQEDILATIRNYYLF